MEEGSDANRRGEDNGVPRPAFAVEDRQQRSLEYLQTYYNVGLTSTSAVS